MQNGYSFRVPGAFGALVMAFLLVVPGLGAQQGGTVTGRVLDAQSGQPIPAVQVFISSLDLGGLTQQNGRYLLQNVPAGTHTLAVARIGYRTVEVQITVGGGQTVEQNFGLAEEALQLDEIIVTGTPGGTQRRAIGNVVTTVDVSAIVQDVAISSFQDLLTARSTGIQFTSVSANVGVSSGIKIRGVGSFLLDTQPLIYVDGLRVNNNDSAGPSTGGFGSSVSVLDDFNPQDIESIEIIKGPAAATLYGTEASAGVIQIITKRGAVGAPQFNVTIRQGTNFITNPQAKIGPQYGCSLDGGPHNVGCRDIDSPNLFLFNMYDEATRYIKEGYFPWETKDVFQNGYVQSYNVDVSGGTDALRYFISANYDNEEGVVWYNSDETFRLRGNISVVFGADFSLDVSTGYVDGFTRFANPGFLQGGVWTDLVVSTGYFLDRITPFDYVDPGGNSFNNGNPRLGGFYNHLPSDVSDIQALRDYSRFTGSTTLRHNYGDWLNQRLVVGIDKAWDINTNLYPKENGPVPESVAEFTDTWSAVFARTAAGELNYSRPSEDNFTFDYNITADYDYNDAFRFTTSFGAQYYIETRERFSDLGQGFASPLSTTINQLSVYSPPSYALITNKSLGFYVQERVSWNDRLFFTASMRFDENSTFGINAPARRYPNVSGAWVVSEESFFNVGFINSLRLRGAWGKAGRQPSATAAINTFTVIVGPTGVPAIRSQSPGNDAIEPEVSTETELGFEIAMFDDRVSGDFTYYTRIDRNALLNEPLTPSLGFPGSVQKNLGRIDNWGWEARVSLRVYENDAFAFDLDFSADHTMNEIKKLGTSPGNFFAGGRQIGVPYPNHGVFNRVTDAVFGDGLGTPIFINGFNEFISAMCDPGVSLAPADVQARAEDTTLPQGEQDAADFALEQYALIEGGEPVPCAYGLTNLFAGPAFATYTFTVAPRLSLLNNSLQIFALAEGQYGRINRDDLTDWGHHRFHNSLVARFETDPVFVVEETLSFDSETWAKTLYDADFWRIREAGARYNFSPALAEKIGAGRASIAFSVRNLWTPYRAQTTISGGTIADPELGRSSDDGSGNYWVMPPSASMNLTLRVSF